jgi:hypothetical protein
MRLFDWLTLGINALTSVLWFLQWRLNQAHCRINREQAGLNQMTETRIGKLVEVGRLLAGAPRK